MTGQRTKFIISGGVVALPTAPMPAESSRYRVILNKVGTGPLVLLCRDAGQRHQRVRKPMALRAAHDSRGTRAIVRKVDGT